MSTVWGGLLKLLDVLVLQNVYTLHSALVCSMLLFLVFIL